MKNKTSRTNSMKLKKVIAASLAVFILFAFTGCKTSSGSATTERSKQEDTSTTDSSSSGDLNEKLNDVYDIIISNPPYIGIDEENEIADSVKDFEPKIALFSPTQNPLIFYKKIAQDCKNFLLKDGLLLLEINQKLGKETLDLFRDILSETLLIKDLSGNNRFIFGKK